jgi:peptidyl-prolyl cis-trans isomerase B (cyclophilin B)
VAAGRDDEARHWESISAGILAAPGVSSRHLEVVMRHPALVLGVIAVLFLLPGASQPGQASETQAPIVVLELDKGIIEIETYPDDAPKSVAHFVGLAKRGFYRGQRFHWVQPGVIQAGDPLSRDMTKQREWGTGGSGPRLSAKFLGVFEPSPRKFVRGSVGLAYRSGFKPEQADSQFFILTGANPALDGKYAMLGHVTKGMDVVTKVALLDVIKNVSVR